MGAMDAPFVKAISSLHFEYLAPLKSLFYPGFFFYFTQKFFYHTKLTWKTTIIKYLGGNAVLKIF